MTTGQITANLPSRDFDATEEFYATLGFRTDFRNEDWMILSRDGMMVEFFPHPDLDPGQSFFSACLRLPEIDGLHADWRAATGLAGSRDAIPRLTDPFKLADAPRMFALVDPDGSLWRVLECE
jgi:catechol 2,3-dioxygenase-like lactoylglutathione lyase family enzyme